MKVTVLITLYNKGPYVKEAVQSVLSSTFTDFELLLVDDASTDGGLDVVKGLADPRIRILESAVNTGRGAAANRGYDAARGEYVAVLDADDIMLPERLAKQVTFMDAYPEVGVSSTWLRSFGTADAVARKPVTDADIRSRLLPGIPVSYGACIIRRSVLEEHALRCDPTWLTPGMDHLFLVRLGLYAQYANIPEALTLYRVGEQNMDHGRDRTADRRLMLRETFRLLDIPVRQEEVDLHLMLANLHTSPPTPERVRALAAWLKRLTAYNRSTGQFPVAEFEKQLDILWERTFHPLTDHSAAAGWTQLCLTDPSDPRKLYYLVRSLGRSRASSPSVSTARS
jgi:glycosyltransferase involved in cell wall biosynthesis